MHTIFFIAAGTVIGLATVAAPAQAATVALSAEGRVWQVGPGGGAPRVWADGPELAPIGSNLLTARVAVTRRKSSFPASGVPAAAV